MIKQININYDKSIYYMVLLLAFVLPLSRAIISLLVILLPLIWILDGNLTEKYKQIKSNKLLVFLVLYLLFSLFSTLWSTNLDEAINNIRLYSYLLVIFVIATKIQREQISSIITAFLLGMFISEFIAYGVFFELWEFKHATVTNPSPFMMHILYSVFLAFTSILLLNRIISKKYTLKEKLVFLFFFLTVTGNLFLATGRTGQVALIAGVFVLMILHYRLGIKSILLSLILLSTIFITAYNLSNSFESRTKATLQDIQNVSNMNLNGSLGIRVAYWITSFDILKEHPLLGVGIGDFHEETAALLKNTNDYPYLNSDTIKFMSKRHPHNQYLLVVTQVGIIGLILFLYMVYRMFLLQIKDPEMKKLSILFSTIFFISCFTEPLLIKQFTIALFILFVGLFTITENAPDTNKS